MNGTYKKAEDDVRRRSGRHPFLPSVRPPADVTPEGGPRHGYRGKCASARAGQLGQPGRGLLPFWPPHGRWDGGPCPGRCVQGPPEPCGPVTAQGITTLKPQHPTAPARRVGRVKGMKPQHGFARAASRCSWWKYWSCRACRRSSCTRRSGVTIVAACRCGSLSRTHGVTWRTVRKALDSAWPEPRRNLDPPRSRTSLPGPDQTRGEEQRHDRLERVVRQSAYVPANVCEVTPKVNGFRLEIRLR